jgi:hypothetical protein
MIWGCITHNVSPVDGNINSRKYIEILDNNLWPVISTRKDIYFLEQCPSSYL